MRFALFYHSLVSDWNHASAHVLRGVATELLARGHAVRIFEPSDGWSLHNLREQGGDGVVKAFHATYPRLGSNFYDPITLDLDEALGDADVVIAHEWNDAGFLQRLGDHRARTCAYKLLFHDAPHRFLAKPLEVRARALSNFDGVLAASDALRQMYEDEDWVAHAWTWRDAVDTTVFRPRATDPIRSLDLIWVGSWGTGQRMSEMNEFLIDPIRALGLRARFYGARYPEAALRELRASRIDYGGWIPDFGIPAALGAARFTVHVPRRLPFERFPPHSPVIRVLEALACGVPVVTAPWEECAGVFTPDLDLLVARDGQQTERHLTALHGDPEFARFIAANGYQTVMHGHTCAHRVQELLSICRLLGVDEAPHEAEFEPSAKVAALRPERSHAPAAWS